MTSPARLPSSALLKRWSRPCSCCVLRGDCAACNPDRPLFVLHLRVRSFRTQQDRVADSPHRDQYTSDNEVKPRVNVTEVARTAERRTHNPARWRSRPHGRHPAAKEEDRPSETDDENEAASD